MRPDTGVEGSGPIGSLGVVVVQPRWWSGDGGRNLDGIGRLLERAGVVESNDLVVLPELVGADMAHDRYLAMVAGLARSLGAWVVGGSHHHADRWRVVNAGAVAGPDGTVVAEYDKFHPYGVDVESAVAPGDRLGAFEIGGRQVLVVVCADFWHSARLHAAPARPHVIAVPSFSVTRLRPATPARRIWHHMAIGRAYEFGAFVAISDWHGTVAYGRHASSAVAGMAHPYPTGSQQLFSPLGARRLRRWLLDLTVIDGLRGDRVDRRFLTVPGDGHPRGLVGPRDI